MAQQVVVLGGNFAGLTAALSLKHALEDGNATPWPHDEKTDSWG